MRFFTYISSTYATKNALEADVLKHLQSLDRKLIADVDLEAFKTRLFLRVELFNQKHHRCQPIKLEFHKSSRISNEERDFVLRWNGNQGFNGHAVCNFYILAEAI
jgi:hypothetical protein